MDNKKVSSEKDTEKKKRAYKKREPAVKKEEVNEESFVNPDVIPETMEEMEQRADKAAAEAREEIARNEIELLKEQVRLLQEANAAKDAENKRLLDLSARVLDNTDVAAHKEKTTNQEKTIPVKCLELNGVELSSPNRDTIITLPYDIWIDCDVEELAQIFKKISNRSLFEDGICIMEESGYKQFKLKPKIKIDIDAIVELLDKGNEQDIVNEFNRLTNNQKNVSVSHLILYSIVGRSLDGELNRLPRASVEAIEMYFGVKMRDCETLLKLFRGIKE